jgi:hypothetical protein
MDNLDQIQQNIPENVTNDQSNINQGIVIPNGDHIVTNGDLRDDQDNADNEEREVEDPNNDNVDTQQESDDTSDETKQIENEGDGEETDITFNTHVQLLKDANLLYLPEDFNVTEENLQEAYELSEQNRMNMMYNQLIDNMPEELRSVVQYGLEGGTNINQLLEIKSKGKTDYNPNNANDQEAIIRDYLSLKGTEAEVIDTYIDSLKKNETLKVESKKRLVDLKNHYEDQENEFKKEEAARLAELEKSQKVFNEGLINNIKAQKMNARDKEDLMNYIYDESRMQTVVDKVLTNPDDLVVFAKILKDFYNPKDGFNLNKLYGNEVSEKKKLADTLKRSLSQSNVKTRQSQHNQGADVDPRNIQIMLG